MSKSPREAIELIALKEKKKKKRQKTKIVVNLQHRSGTNPKIRWDILVVEILVLSFQMFALLHSAVFSLAFNESLKLLSLWSDQNPKTLVFRWILKLPRFAGMNWKAWNVNGVRTSEAGESGCLFAVWFPKEIRLAWLYFVVNFSFTGIRYQKNISLQKFE